MLDARGFFVFIFIIALFACNEEPAAEKPQELIVGVWENSMIVSEQGSYTPEKDSILFHSKGRRKQLSFNSRGTFCENGQLLHTKPYFILNRQLYVVDSGDTMVSNIDQIDRNRMVLSREGVKKYYTRFVY